MSLVFYVLVTLVWFKILGTWNLAVDAWAINHTTESPALFVKQLSRNSQVAIKKCKYVIKLNI